MDIMELLSILGEALYSVCLFGTGIVIVLGILAIITKNSIIRKTASSLGILVLLMWIGQLAASISYLFTGTGKM